MVTRLWLLPYGKNTTECRARPEDGLRIGRGVIRCTGCKRTPPTRWRAGAVEERLHGFKRCMTPVALEYNWSYTIRMKTAVSIRDEVFNAAEHTASVMGISRSQLYTKAVEEFVLRHSCEHVTERLNAVYEGADSNSSLDSTLEHLQFLSLPSDDKW